MGGVWWPDGRRSSRSVGRSTDRSVEHNEICFVMFVGTGSRSVVHSCGRSSYSWVRGPRGCGGGGLERRAIAVIGRAPPTRLPSCGRAGWWATSEDAGDDGEERLGLRDEVLVGPALAHHAAQFRLGRSPLARGWREERGPLCRSLPGATSASSTQAPRTCRDAARLGTGGEDGGRAAQRGVRARRARHRRCRGARREQLAPELASSSGAKPAGFLGG